jgi:DNA topoisomerase-2
VERESGQGFLSIGKVESATSKKVVISELPLGRWTNDYKAFLGKMCEKGEIQSFVENHTTTSVSFTVNVEATQLSKMREKGLEEVFKLVTNLSTSNMHAFGADNTIVKFTTAEEIAEAYFPTRYNLYIDRKSVLQSEMSFSAAVMMNKARFIQSVVDGEVDLIRQRQTKEQTVRRLAELGFDDSNRLKSIRQDNALYKKRASRLIDESLVDGEGNELGQYDYLLNMPISSLTAEKIAELHRSVKKTETNLDELKKTTPEDLWIKDLNQLEKHLN